IIYFVFWNVFRMSFMWYTQEAGYKAGSKITEDLSGGVLQDITKRASILGMFILETLVNTCVSMTFTPTVYSFNLHNESYIDWANLPAGTEGLITAFEQFDAGLALSEIEVTTLQDNLDSLIPGLAPLLLTFLCMWFLRKKISPIIIILGLFVMGVGLHLV